MKVGTCTYETPEALKRLRSLLSYDESTGNFHWISDHSYRKAGAKAGGVKPGGYIFLKVDGVTYRAHRVAWAFVTGDWPKYLIDHKNGIPGDCSFSNLREATASQNLLNRDRQANNTSGFKGVTGVRKNGKYQASISNAGVKIYLGSFDSAEEAHAAYSAMSIKLHGEFSRTGTPNSQVERLNK